MDIQLVLMQASVFDLLARLYLHRPNQEMVATFNDVFQELAESLMLTIEDASAGDSVPLLKSDYDDLFFVPVSGRYLPPFESAQRANRLWGPITYQVADFYQSVGFDRTNLIVDKHWKNLDAPDHIGVELACMSALLRANAAAPTPEMTNAIMFFTRQHLTHWLPDYGERVARYAATSLYHTLGRLTRAFILDFAEVM